MELKSDEHLTLKGEAQSKLTEKRSKFIGLIAPIKDRYDIDIFLEKVRKQHHNPTHIVYAYRLREENGLKEYCTDDGEPAYSAGQPVLKVLQSQNLENIICAVVRYYGGIKLGVGGLIRAYSQTAKLAMEQAEIIKKTEKIQVSVTVKYSAIGMVIKIVEDLDGSVKNMDYGAEYVQISIQLRRSLADSFTDKFNKTVPFNLIKKR